MNDQQHYSVIVTKTVKTRVTVEARSEAEARATAWSASGEPTAESVSTEVVSVWPLNQPEDGPTHIDAEGYHWRRGWFTTANLDFRAVSLLEGDADAFKDLLKGTNETVFSIQRRYGYAFKFGDEALWSEPYAGKKDMCGMARSEARRRERAERERVKEAVQQAAMQDAVQRMSLPGNDGTLIRTQGGRWTLKSVIRDHFHAETNTLSDEAWSIDIHAVRQLLGTGKVRVSAAHESSGDPIEVVLIEEMTTSN